MTNGVRSVSRRAPRYGTSLRSVPTRGSWGTYLLGDPGDGILGTCLLGELGTGASGRAYSGTWRCRALDTESCRVNLSWLSGDMTQWLDERSMAAWMAYVRMRIRVEGEIAFDLERHGLSASDYEVLTTLSAQPDGQMRARDLARQLTWHKARLSRHLARMDKRGLVSRAPAPEDARGIVVTLSPEGRAQLETAVPDHAALIQRVFADQLTEPETAALISLSEKVLAAADRETQGRGAK